MSAIACVTAAGGGLTGPPSVPSPPDAARSGLSGGQGVTTSALDLQGAPYRTGGDTPSGFDCSGFTRYVFGLHGVPLPRRTQEQYAIGARLHAEEDLQPGDLVFFSTVATGPSHVGVALGNDEFIHAPSTRGVVRVEQLTTRYWRERYVGARRVLRPGDRE